MMNKQRMVVEWSPHDPSLFAVGADNLRLYETTSTDVDAGHGGGGMHGAPAATTQRKRSFRLIKINAQVNAHNSQLKCMEWYPFDAKPLWIASGMTNGKVILSDFQDPRSRVVREFTPKYTRPCNAVAWNHASPNQLAAGFEKVRSDYCTLVWDLNAASSGSTIMGSVGGGGNGNGGTLGGGVSADGSLAGGAIIGSHMDAMGGHDELTMGSLTSSVGGGNNSVRAGSYSRNGSGMAMAMGGIGGGSSGVGGGGGGGGAGDLNERPVHELSNSEATVALSWVSLQPACLAVGTGFKWLRIYDLRAATNNGMAPLSVVAHNKAVLGVVFDHHRPHILATFTDAPQEAIKIWDIRRLDTNLGPLVALHHSSKTLAQVTWCPTKPGILATASVEERYLSLWDVTKQDAVGPNGSMQIKKPFKRRYTSEPLTSFSWQHVEPSSSSAMRRVGRDHKASANARLAAAAFPNRLLTASVSGEIEDISVHDSLPISVSPLGSLAFSCGRLLFGGATSERSTNATTTTTANGASGSNTRPVPTPSAVLEDDIAMEMQRLAKSRYSMVVEKNLRLFAASSHTSSSLRPRQLRSLWQWVDQVEALRRIQVSRLAQARGVNHHHHQQQQQPSVAAAASPLRGWPVDPAALTMVGVTNLLALSDDSPSELASLSARATATAAATPLTTIPSSLKTDAVLGCSYYEGFGRRLAMFACHWDPDCGHHANATGNGNNSDAGSLLPPRQSGLTLHRSSSGAWSSQRQFEENAMASSSASFMFGSRSSTENSRHELRHILTKCESESNFSRAAALAVFHGDLVTAVTILQRGALFLSQIQNLNSAVHAPYSSDVLQLVAMAVAGYSTAALPSPGAPGGPGGGGTGMPSMWMSMCQQLLKREEITAQHHPRYLHALLTFLCVGSGAMRGSMAAQQPLQQQQQPTRRGVNRKAWGSVDGLSVLANSTASNSTTTSAGRALAHTASSAHAYATILYDATLPLSDRVAFACRFLPPEDLRVFVLQCQDDCQQHGRLDGLLLTGLSRDGIQLLQRYLDKTGDIQTLALLAARLPSAYVAKHAPVLENWVTIYQDLLNQWQLFHERARLDVARSQHEDVLNGFANFARDPDGEELTHELNAPPTLSVPPQLFVRCNFCSHSLSLANLLRLGGSHSSWLNRAKPKLSCCPSCRKPLPQCALCLLPLGALNPYLELAHRRSKQTENAVSSIVASDAGMSGGGMAAAVEDPVGSSVGGSKLETTHESLAQLSSIPFVEWFTWCQSCKHGGHAHHIADWFATHTMCPVTDCACQCQHMDLPIALQKRQEEARLLQEERQEHDEMLLHQQQQQLQQQQLQLQQQLQQQQQRHSVHSHSLGGGGGNVAGSSAATPSMSPQLGASMQNSAGLPLSRRGSRSQQQMQLAAHNAAMMATTGGAASGMGMGVAGGGAAGGALPPRVAGSSRLGTPLVAGGGGGGSNDLGAAMSGMSLSSKLDQLDKEKGTSFFL